MNKTLLILLLFPFQLFGQNEPEVELKPLKLIDTILPDSTIEDLLKISVYEENDHFFVTGFNQNQGLFLIKKKYEIWKVYELEYESILGLKAQVSYVQKKRKGFVDIQANYSPSGKCSSLYGYGFLLNLESLEVVVIKNIDRQECFDKNGNSLGVRECRAKVEIVNDIIFIETYNYPDEQLGCIQSGEFVKQRGKYVRIN